MKITAIILAAGFSTRMKQNKLLMEIEGERIIDRVIKTVKASDFDEVLLIVNKSFPEFSNGLKVIVNQKSHLGVSTSIKAGVECAASDSEGLAFIMGDQPFITVSTLGAIIDKFREDTTKIVIPVFNGKSGSPVIFPVELKAELASLKGDTGGKTVIAQHRDLVTYIKFDDIKELTDIDTMESYEKEVSYRKTVLIRGGGDLATGVAHALFESGCRVIIAESENPSCIRTEVSFASAIWEDSKTIQGVTSKLIKNPGDRFKIWKEGKIPILVDSDLKSLEEINPDVLVDAIIAKKNCGTHKSMAPLVICMGPGFSAPIDCHLVIETMRGETLGNIISEGPALPDTGTPALVSGHSTERVIHSPADGDIQNIKAIGDFVEENETIAMIGDTPVVSTIPGTLRGLIRNGFPVKKGLKIADVDPRFEKELAFTISDKAAFLGQAVLKAIRSFEIKSN